MVTINDKMIEIVKIDEKLMNEYLSLTTLGTIINLLEEGIDEISNKEIKVKFKELQNLIVNTRENIAKTEINVKREIE